MSAAFWKMWITTSKDRCKELSQMNQSYANIKKTNNTLLHIKILILVCLYPPEESVLTSPWKEKHLNTACQHKKTSRLHLIHQWDLLS